jgi:hypothetical protein
MCSDLGTSALPLVGFPIRTSSDQWLFGAFPRLFAACHVLRRLLAPRHPPYALISLVLMLALAMEFPRCRRKETESPLSGQKKPPARVRPAGWHGRRFRLAVYALPSKVSNDPLLPSPEQPRYSRGPGELSQTTSPLRLAPRWSNARVVLLATVSVVKRTSWAINLL